MLSVIDAYLWKSVGFFVLLAGTYYAFSQRTRIMSHIYSWLRYFFSVPPLANQQSTWPGEENWPLGHPGKQTDETLAGSDDSNMEKQADENKPRPEIIRRFWLKKITNYKRFLSSKRDTLIKR